MKKVRGRRPAGGGRASNEMNTRRRNCDLKRLTVRVVSAPTVPSHLVASRMAVDSPEKPAEEEKPPPTTPFRAPVLETRSCEEIKAIARKCADQPLQNSEPGAWAVLTAISRNARQRQQGMNIALTGDQHCIGRLVDDYSFRINDIAVSGSHCRIFRGNLAAESPVPAFLKDTSTNGTYLNWTKLKKSSPEVRLQHGDIVSFLGPPHEEKAFAFVFREVSYLLLSNKEATKRKTEMLPSPESKRTKGIGVGGPEGPISLDDVRSLQRSNMALRKEVESHVLTIENMRVEARASISHHENEIKELRESLSRSYLDQINELRHIVSIKQKELDDVNAVLSEHQQSSKDLSERLTVSMQSRAEADEIIKSQKGIILEREAQLEEERNQRRVEREKAAADLKSELQRAHQEAQQEIKRQTDVLLQQLREQQEFVFKLQDSERESQLLTESLRVKLEETRDNLVLSEKKTRQLEALLQEEKTICQRNRKRAETLELEVGRLNGELESEKAAREEAWAKVSALELEIAAVIRELSTEKQRFQGARERLILRETQLRAFYSTTEEISALFSKQQHQLKAMQRALEDDDDYDDLAAPPPLHEPHATDSCGGAATAGDNDCTQDLDCTTVDGGATAGEPMETEHVPETESPGDNFRCGGATVGEKMVGTADLLASEGLGSWADCTVPSGHGENDSPSNDGAATAMSDAETEEGGGGSGSEDDTERSIGGDDHVVVEDSMG